MHSAVDWIPFLSEAWRAFTAAAGDQVSLVEQIAGRTGEALGAVIDVALLREGATWADGAFSHGPSPTTGLLVDKLLSSEPSLLASLERGEPVLLSEPTVLAARQLSSLALWPLAARARTLGIVTALRRQGQPPLQARELQLGLLLADRAAMAIEHGLALTAARNERLERERVAERLRAVAQASRAFSAAASDYKTLLDVVARTVGELLGDLCSIRLVSEDGQWLAAEDAGVYHRDREIAELFRAAIERTPMRVGEGFGGAVVRSGQPVIMLVPEADAIAQRTIPSYRPLLERFDAGSMLVLPLKSRDKCIGVLSLSRARSSPPYDEDDLRLAQDLADRAALAFENSGLVTALAEQVSQLGRAEEKFRQLLELAPDAIVSLDSAGTIVLVNGQAQELFGYARQELLGQRFELLVPERHRAVARQLSLTNLGPGATVFELRGLRKNGTEFPAEVKLCPIQTRDGQLTTTIVRDVSERERLEEARERTRQLETENERSLQANRLKSAFLANMSHELRTPLNAIIGFSSLMHAGKAGPLGETQREYVGDILSSSRHLLQLINDVLDVAKIEAGHLDFSAEPVDLRQIVAEVRDTLRSLAMEKRLTLSIDVSSDLRQVVTDRRLLKQVLYNLLSNAIKFTPAEGAVTIDLQPVPKQRFAIRVEDNGIGVKPEDMARLFQEFQQLDSGMAKRYPGTGLGLALTKRLVEAQGGSVRAESTWGRGSVFIAELPRAPLANPAGHVE